MSREMKTAISLCRNTSALSGTSGACVWCFCRTPLPPLSLRVAIFAQQLGNWNFAPNFALYALGVGRGFPASPY